MYGRKVKLRFFFILLIISVLVLSVFLVLKSLEENVVYFKSLENGLEALPARALPVPFCFHGLRVENLTLLRFF